VTVLLAGLENATTGPRCVVVDPLTGREALYAAIVADLTPRGTPADTARRPG